MRVTFFSVSLGSSGRRAWHSCCCCYKSNALLVNPRQASIELTTRCCWSRWSASCCSRCLRSSSCRRRSFSRSAANERWYSSSCCRLSSSRFSRTTSSSVSRCRCSLKESWHWIRLSRTSLGVLFPSMISTNSNEPRDRAKIKSRGKASLSVVAKRWAHWLPTHRRTVSINLTNENRIHWDNRRRFAGFCLTDFDYYPKSCPMPRTHSYSLDTPQSSQRITLGSRRHWRRRIDHCEDRWLTDVSIKGRNVSVPFGWAKKQNSYVVNWRVQWLLNGVI